MSDHGLLTTLAYKLGRDKPAFYALEVFQASRLLLCFALLRCSHGLGALQGSVAIAGAVVRWLQDNLGIIGSSEELGTPPGVFGLAVVFFMCSWMSFFICREAGSIRRDVLRLLLCSRLLWAVRPLLGA